MKAEYDLSKLKALKNPSASKLNKAVTPRLSEDMVAYFKGVAADASTPCQDLINLYLRDCIANHRKAQIKWLHAARGLTAQGSRHEPLWLRASVAAVLFIMQRAGERHI